MNHSKINVRRRRLNRFVPAVGLALLVVVIYIQKHHVYFHNIDISDYTFALLFGLSVGSGVYLLGRHIQVRQKQSLQNAEKFELLLKRHQFFIDSIDEGICEIDEDGLCTFVNEAAVKMFGHGEYDLVGQRFCALVHHRDCDGHSREVEQSRLHKAMLAGLTTVINNEVFWRKDGSWFHARVKHYPLEKSSLLVFCDITSDKIMQRQLGYARSQEVPIGVVSKKTLRSSITALLEGSGEDCGTHALFVIDLDRFKVVNQTIGYSAGDLMLDDFSSYLKAVVQSRGITARISGDQFSVLLRDCNSLSADQFGDSLLALIERYSFVWQERSFRVSASIGFCLINSKTTSADSVLLGADAACCSAKEAGRRRCHCYNPNGEEYRQLHHKMEAVPQIQLALDNDMFFLRQQKIAPLHTGGGQRCGFEVLVSMKQECGAVVPPFDFLPAAELFDLMPDIDRWVVKNIFAWINSHPQQCAMLDFISLNLSGKSFNHDPFLDFLKHEISMCSLDKRKLCFEITETAAVKHKDKALYFIHEIKKLGCRFALDDFGSGMSSFGYLKSFPVDFIKIDGSFVKDMRSDPLSRQIVESIHAISTTLGIQTIAEHAEDQQSLELLQRIGIDYVQGYVIEKPQILC